MPNHLRELAVITARYHTHVHRAFELRAATVLNTLESCDALRRPERFADFLLACEADVRGRTGLEDRSYPQRAYFAAARDAAAAVALTAEERAGLSGEQIGEELRQRRIAAIEALKQIPRRAGSKLRAREHDSIKRARMSWLEAIILGLVEGITEFLPVSSTGHLILTQALLGLKGAAVERHIIIIQGAAILAVCWEFRKKLLHTAFTLHSDAVSRRFLFNLFIASIPLAVLGLMFEEQIKAFLFNPVTVAIALVVGGVIILWAERRKHEERVQSVDELTTMDAVKLGLFQALALIPGTSRSGRDDHRRFAERPVPAHGRGVFILPGHSGVAGGHRL